MQQPAASLPSLPVKQSNHVESEPEESSNPLDTGHRHKVNLTQRQSLHGKRPKAVCGSDMSHQIHGRQNPLTPWSSEPRIAQPALECSRAAAEESAMSLYAPSHLKIRNFVNWFNLQGRPAEPSRPANTSATPSVCTNHSSLAGSKQPVHSHPRPEISR